MLGAITDGKIRIIGAKKTAVPMKILRLLLKNNEMSISEIHNSLAKSGDKYNYRTIWQHINSMNGEWVDIEKKEHETGKPVIVKLKDIFKGLKLQDI